MNFAVVEIAGKQFLVGKGDVIETPKIPGPAGEKVNFRSVLLYWDGKKLAVGRPYLEGAVVEGKILEFGRSPKIVAYKYKRRKDSHRKIGHRQDFARVKVEKISPAGKASGEKEKEVPAVKPPAKTTAAKKASPRKKSPAGKKVGAGKKPPAGKSTAAKGKSSAGKKAPKSS